MSHQVPLLLAWVCLIVAGTQCLDVIDYVDPTIGTAGEGYGMVRLGPDTCYFNDRDIFIVWNHNGGYYYGDDQIRVFSHIHLQGAGITDLGNIAVIPITKEPNSDIVTNNGYRSYFRHATETVEVGYYAVNLDTWGVKVELTSTPRCGVHRYTFEAGKTPYIAFPISYGIDWVINHGNPCMGSSITIDPDSREIYGWVNNSGSFTSRIGGMKPYFVAKFSKEITKFVNYGVWNDGQVSKGTKQGGGTTAGAWVELEQGTGPVEMYVGISFVSVENARANLAKELHNFQWTFDTVKQDSQKDWNEQLSQVSVQTSSSLSSRQELTKFYTGLYHSFCAPTTYSDVNGEYLGFDKRTHSVAEAPKDDLPRRWMSDMSIWDTHRTKFPLLTLLKPDVMQDAVRSLLLMYDQGGDLPRWPLGNGYTGSMIGQHADVVISDAYTKGVTSFNLSKAYKAMAKGALTVQRHAGRGGLSSWLTKGYVSYEAEHNGAALTLAYSYDDWAIGILARRIPGLQKEAQMFLSRSKNYRNVWNNESQFFCARYSSGKWNCPELLGYLDPWDGRFTEGNAWQWRWFVPHDPAGLIGLFSSKEYFVSQLSEFFERSQEDPYNVLPNPYYWAGNEPDLFAVWLFDFAGRADLAQKYSRMVMKNRYLTSPDGIPGNDDYGALSAWYVWAALGIYPQAGNTTFMFGSPLFEKVVVQLKRGTLTLIAHGASDTNIYVEKIMVNGHTYTSALIENAMLTTGNTTIEFWMSDTPHPYALSGIVLP